MGRLGNGITSVQLLKSLDHGLLIEVYETHVLLEVFEFRLDSPLLNFEAVVVFHFDTGALGLNLVKESLELGIDKFEVFNTLETHFVVDIISLLHKAFGFLRQFLKLLNDGLCILSENINRFFFSHEVMARMINNALDTDQSHASIAKMSHNFFWMLSTKVGFLHHLILSLSIIQGDEILGKLFRPEWFGYGGPTNRTASESLLVNLDQALLTESMTGILRIL